MSNTACRQAGIACACERRRQHEIYDATSIILPLQAAAFYAGARETESTAGVPTRGGDVLEERRINLHRRIDIANASVRADDAEQQGTLIANRTRARAFLLRHSALRLAASAVPFFRVQFTGRENDDSQDGRPRKFDPYAMW